MSEITIKKNGKVLEIQLNRLAVKNALSLQMYADLVLHLQQFEQDDALHAALVYGDESCFCAGNDLQDFLSGGELNEAHPTIQFINLIGKLKKPLVAAVAGPAVGIGTTMLLHCDLVYSADNTVFQLPFAKLGLCPEAGSSLLLPRIAGHVKAFEWLVLGERFTAQDAKSAGLVNEVVTPETLISLAREKTQALASLPLSSVLASKQLIKQGDHQRIDRQIEVEIEHFSELLASESTQQIIRSFFKK